MVDARGQQRTMDAVPRLRRITSLDGLRGVAALVVLLYHCAVIVPSTYAAMTGMPSAPSWARGLALSPVGAVVSGEEAVWVFFVLSGFVVSKPFFASEPSGRAWRAYYPSRLLRLYGPVWAAIGVALVLVLLVPRVTSATFVPPVNGTAEPIGPLGLVRDLVLITGTTQLDPALWSLQWEVLFSLLLPVYVAVTRRVSTRNGTVWATAAVYLLLIAVGGLLTGRFESPLAQQAVAALTYLPMFGLGALVACRWDAMSSTMTRSTARLSVIFVVGILLLTSRRTLIGLNAPSDVSYPCVALGAAGAILLIVVSIELDWLRSALQSRPVRFLGTISFSLYLIHQPVLLCLRSLFAEQPAWLVIAVGFPVAILAAWGFWAVLEKPIHGASKRIRRMIASR